MMEAVRFFETTFLTTATRRNIPEDGILQAISCRLPTTVAWVLAPVIHVRLLVDKAKLGNVFS
jgi:hypothetical protein